MEESDLDLMLRVLDKWNVQYELNRVEGSSSVVLNAKSKGVEGYQGFFTEFCFDEDDKFSEIGIWE